MRLSWVVFLTLVLGCAPAWAALGDSVASVNSDVQALGGQHRLVARSGYNLHQITAADGSVVNEFVSPAGKVFGISWQGRGIPDLHQLLGSYMTELQHGQRTGHIPRRAVTIETPDFVYTSMGHERSFHGYAYVRSLIPSNLTPEVIQ